MQTCNDGAGASRFNRCCGRHLRSLRDFNASIGIACVEFHERRTRLNARALLDEYFRHDAADMCADENRFTRRFDNSHASNAIREQD